MKMKLAVSLCAFIGICGNAMANNTIRFLGEVTDQTCTVSVNGADANPIVLLPTVSAGSLASQGSTAGETPFNVTLKGCNVGATSTLKQSQIRFVSNDIEGTNLKNIAATTPATKVAVQIVDVDASNTALDFTAGEALTTTVKPVGGDGGNEAAQFNMQARYYATAANPTPGAVEAKVQFAITYK